MIEVLPGKGTFVIGETILEGDEGIVQWFKQHVNEEYDFLEVRDALDRKAASLSAQRASDSEIAAMADLLNEAQSCLEHGDLDRMVSLDNEFHCSIAETSGNDMLCHLLTSVHEAMVNPAPLADSAERPWGGFAKEHRAILEAIRQRDPVAGSRPSARTTTACARRSNR